MLLATTLLLQEYSDTSHENPLNWTMANNELPKCLNEGYSNITCKRMRCGNERSAHAQLCFYCTRSEFDPDGPYAESVSSDSETTDSGCSPVPGNGLS